MKAKGTTEIWPRFEVYESKSKWYWRFVARNGRVMADGGHGRNYAEMPQCPLWVKSGHSAIPSPMSAFGGKADIKPTRHPHLPARLRVRGPESRISLEMRESGSGPKENSLRLLSFLGFKAGLFQPRCAEVIHCHSGSLLMFVPVS